VGDSEVVGCVLRLDFPEDIWVGNRENVGTVEEGGELLGCCVSSRQ